MKHSFCSIDVEISGMGIHFGVDYYPEHWPRERWETDAKLIKEMGVQVS